MSIQAVAWVLDNSRSRGFPRLVLISLANHADKETGECWPAQRTIAAEAGISAGAVPAALRNLVALGEVEVVKPGGPRTSTIYRLTFSRSGDEHENAQEMSAARGPGVSAARGPGVSGTIIDRHEPDDAQARKPEPYTAEFEQWWSGYPRKNDKRGAFNAFKARRRAGVSVERLTVARDNYLRAKSDDTFLKYGKTFLEHNDGPWSEFEQRPATLEELAEPAVRPDEFISCHSCRDSRYIDETDGEGKTRARPCPACNATVPA